MLWYVRVASVNSRSANLIPTKTVGYQYRRTELSVKRFGGGAGDRSMRRGYFERSRSTQLRAIRVEGVLPLTMSMPPTQPVPVSVAESVKSASF